MVKELLQQCCIYFSEIYEKLRVQCLSYLKSTFFEVGANNYEQNFLI